MGSERPSPLGLCLRGACVSPEKELSWTGLLAQKCLREEDRRPVAARWCNFHLAHLCWDPFRHHPCYTFSSKHLVSCPLLITFTSISYSPVASLTWVEKWPFLKITQRKDVLLPFLLIIFIEFIIAPTCPCSPQDQWKKDEKRQKKKKGFPFFSLLFSVFLTSLILRGVQNVQLL